MLDGEEDEVGEGEERKDVYYSSVLIDRIAKNSHYSMLNIPGRRLIKRQNNNDNNQFFLCVKPEFCCCCCC